LKDVLIDALETPGKKSDSSRSVGERARAGMINTKYVRKQQSCIFICVYQSYMVLILQDEPQYGLGNLT